ncbi:hypothetical protein [Petroclostridium sp. X23]|uniref:hypothetical protein n=1 Tax=Petroclostridium sp. X23 TaxID=3045146 RepID=UPI0024AC834D|nr:hypothetical protein [Petroclostridium sp. X23]WHH59963.1 hypothetical protein QKW49_04220 [Petroclostridium sp. X23]
MGCGGYRNPFDLFDLFDSCEPSRRQGHGSRYDSCGSGNYHNDYERYNDHRQNDSDEKLILLKKIFAEGNIDEVEYQKLKQRIYENTITFADLVRIRADRLDVQNHNTKQNKNTNTSHTENDYEEKIKKLHQTKQKIIAVLNKLSEEIQGLKNDKEKMDTLAEAMLKASEEKAETFIRKKLDIEESIQNLEKRNYELKNQIEEIDNMEKVLQSKKLELEALRLQEEVSNMKLNFND